MRELWVYDELWFISFEDKFNDNFYVECLHSAAYVKELEENPAFVNFKIFSEQRIYPFRI